MWSKVHVYLGMLTMICSAALVFSSSVPFQPSTALADVNVRYHLIPGVKLNAKPLSQAAKNTVLKQQTPPRHQPPHESGTSKTSSFENRQKSANAASWEPHCVDPVRVSFFGDYWVPPHGPAAQLKNSLFDNLIPLLNWGDFNVANFEGSITNQTKRAFPKFPFALKQAPESLEWLSAAGVKHFFRANNHAMDFGWVGAQDTNSQMVKAKVSYAGIGGDIHAALKPMWLEKNGIKIAVFSITTTYPAEAWAGEKRAGVAYPAANAMRVAIEKARAEADFIVVGFHWGEELKPTVKSHQTEYAQLALKAGADFVVGHHAHLAQKIETTRNDEMIVYGVGNFIFSSLSRDAKFALGAHAEFCRSDVADETGSTHHYRLVFTPLTTYNRVTGYRSRPMVLSEFLPFAGEYLKKGYFPSELEFYIPAENQVRTLSEWLQAGPQASKEGRIVN
ncbi:MAG: CapA family protein [Silvanigrellaceae bacterium]